MRKEPRPAMTADPYADLPHDHPAWYPPDRHADRARWYPNSRYSTAAPPSQGTTVTRPWDPAGLPLRTEAQRCRYHHGHCAYRDDDPTRCPRCHCDWTVIATRDEHACEKKYGVIRPDAPAGRGAA